MLFMEMGLSERWLAIVQRSLRDTNTSFQLKNKPLNCLPVSLRENWEYIIGTNPENEKSHHDDYSKPPVLLMIIGEADGIRTRDLQRDRAVLDLLREG